MAKRFLAFMISVVFMLLCGCRGKTSDYAEPEKRLYVSALGFDVSGDKIKVLAETVSVADNTASDQYKVTRYGGEGESVEAAMFEIKKDLVLLPDLNHCALLVMGEDVTKESLAELTEYCFRDNEIAQSVQMVTCESAEKLLKSHREGEKPLGFGISELLSRDADGTDSRRETTLLSVMNSRKEGELYCLPYFETEGKECVLRGWRMYKGENLVHRLNRTEMQLLKIAEDSFGSGEIKLQSIPEAPVINVKSAKTTASWEDTDGEVLNMTVKIETDNKASRTQPEKAMSEEITRLISDLREKGLDPLQVGELIKEKYHSLGAGGVEELFQKTRVKVKCRVEVESR